MTLGMLRFGRAYYHHMGWLDMLRAIIDARHMKSQPETLIYGFGTLLAGWSAMERLPSIDAPTLVLAGRDDFQYPPSHQQELASAIPGAHLVLIDTAGHNAPTRDPRRSWPRSASSCASHAPTGQDHGLSLPQARRSLR